jgi:hypothetical protein
MNFFSFCSSWTDFISFEITKDSFAVQCNVSCEFLSRLEIHHSNAFLAFRVSAEKYAVNPVAL